MEIIVIQAEAELSPEAFCPLLDLEEAEKSSTMAIIKSMTVKAKINKGMNNIPKFF